VCAVVDDTGPSAAASVTDEPPSGDDVLGVDDLAGLTDDAFRGYVTGHLRDGMDRDAWPLLTDHRVVSRTRGTLVTMQDQLDDAIRKRTDAHQAFRARSGHPDAAWRHEDTQYTEWRRKAVAFRRAIARKLQHIRVAAREANRADAALAGYHRRAVRELATAIDRHRTATLASGITPERPDRALWTILDDVTIPAGSNVVSLTTMLHRWRGEET
jgi:hypothetical protein